MAHWQAGQRDQARKWYAQAVDWMEKNKSQDEELRRFRDEAAALLGVSDGPSSTSKTEQSKPRSSKP
jgi:hypothetical protein